MFKSTEIDQLYHDIFKFKIKTITVYVKTLFLIISKEVIPINHTKFLYYFIEKKYAFSTP